MTEARPDVFISYCRRDEVAAAELQRALEAKGFSIWRDRTGGIENGDKFPAEIIDGIFRAAAVVVLWSKESAGRPWVLDEALLGYALNRLHPVLLEQDVSEHLEERYREIDSAAYHDGLSQEERDVQIDRLSRGINATKARTPPFLRRRPPSKKDRERNMSALLHAVLNAKFCFEAYNEDVERAASTRFMPAINELLKWPEATVREAVSRFGDNTSPGEAIWALYMAAEKINSQTLWKTVGRAVQPFSMLMSMACFQRAGASEEALESEFYPVKVATLVADRRQSVPKPPPPPPPKASPPPLAPQVRTPAIEAARSVSLPEEPIDEATVRKLPWTSRPPFAVAAIVFLVLGSLFIVWELLLALGFLGSLITSQHIERSEIAAAAGDESKAIDQSIPTPVSQPAEEPKIWTYVVIAGDTCWDIAARVSRDERETDLRCKQLQALNRGLRLQGPHSLIRPGDKLTMPADFPRTLRQ